MSKVISHPEKNKDISIFFDNPLPQCFPKITNPFKNICKKLRVHALHHTQIFVSDQILACFKDAIPATTESLHSRRQSFSDSLEMWCIGFPKYFWYIFPWIVIEICPRLNWPGHPTHNGAVPWQNITNSCFKIEGIVSHFFPETNHFAVIVIQFIVLQSLR